MEIQDMLHFPVFNGAKLLTGDIGIHNEIESAMVLEAIDIENWGKKNQVILTSLYALDDLSKEDITLFFDKMKKIGISGLIIKINRHVNMIPNNIIDLCKQASIALIKIPKDTSYESILISIFEPLLNKQSFILRTFYDTYRTFNKLDNLNASYPDIINEVHRLIDKDIELLIPAKNINIYLGDKHQIDHVNVTNSKAITIPYTQHRYYLKTCETASDTYYSISTKVHNSFISDFSINIYQDTTEINDSEIMVVENAIVMIQHQLEIKYMGQREMYAQLNSLAASILHNTTRNESEYHSLLEEAGLTKHDYYQLVGVIKTEAGKRTEKNNTLNALKTLNIPYLYYEHRYYFVIIFNLDKDDKRLSSTYLNTYSDQLDKKHLTISHKSTQLDINKLYSEIKDLLNFKRHYQSDNILTADDLGVLRLFNQNNYEEVQTYIPEKIKLLHKNELELFNTLYTFILNSQNYTKTGEDLFIHAKTVRYRINKIKELLEIDLDNHVQLLNYAISIYLINLNENE